MVNQKKYKKQVNVGAVKVGKKKDPSEADTFYLSLRDGYSIVDKDGNVLNVKNISFQNPVKRRERLLQNENFTGDRAKLQQEIEAYSKGGDRSFVKFEAFVSVD